MKVALGTIDFNDVARRAIAHYHGHSGLASREDVRHFYIAHADADLQQVITEWRQQQDPEVSR